MISRVVHILRAAFFIGCLWCHSRLFAAPEYLTTLRQNNAILKIIHHNGRLWCATPSCIKWLDLRSQTWGCLMDGKKPFAPDIKAVESDGSSLWILATNTISRFDFNKKTLVTISLDVQNRTPVGLAISEDRLHIAFINHVVHINGVRQGGRQNSTVMSYSRSNPTQILTTVSIDDRITCLLADEGAIWIGQPDAISVFHAHSGTLVEYRPNEELPDVTLGYHCAMVADKKSVWVGGGMESKGQLLRFDKSIQRWETEESRFTLPLFKQGDLLWVGASYDVANQSEFVLKYIKDAASDWKGVFKYGWDPITAIYPLGEDIWVGTSNGLLRFQPKDRRFVRIRHEPLLSGQEPSSHHNQLRSDGQRLITNRGNLNPTDGIWQTDYVETQSMALINHQIPAGEGKMWRINYQPGYLDDYEGDHRPFRLTLELLAPQPSTSKVIPLPQEIENTFVGMYPASYQDSSALPYSFADTGKDFWIGGRATGVHTTAHSGEPRITLSVESGLWRFPKPAGPWQKISTPLLVDSNSPTSLPSGLNQLPSGDIRFLTALGNFLVAGTSRGCFLLTGEKWTLLQSGIIEEGGMVGNLLWLKFTSITDSSNSLAYGKITQTPWISMTLTAGEDIRSDPTPMADSLLFLTSARLIKLFPDRQKCESFEFTSDQISQIAFLKGQLWGISRGALLKLMLAQGKILTEEPFIQLTTHEQILPSAEAFNLPVLPPP